MARTRTQNSAPLSTTSKPKPRRRDLIAMVEDLRLHNQELNEEALRAREDRDEVQQQLVEAQAQVQDSVSTNIDDQIPRPYGAAGDRRRGFILQDAAGLQNRPKLYKALRRLIKSIMARADFDYRKTWRQQSSRKIEQVCVLAAERQPFLRRFANDWATKAFMVIYLKNRRTYLRGLGADEDEPEPAVVNAGEHNNDDESDDNDME